MATRKTSKSNALAGWAILNGRLIKSRQANISIFDKGYFFDFAVYSSIKVVQGKLFFPDYHIERLMESAEIIRLEHNFKKEDIKKWLELLTKKNKIIDALLRIVLIGDPAGALSAKLFIIKIAGLTFYPDQIYQQGVKVITYQSERRIPGAKTKDLLLSFLAFRKAHEQEAQEALLVDSQGNIRECTQSNFFAIICGYLITPPKEIVLGGITKKIVLEVVKGFLEFKEEDIPLSKIKDYEEFFITSTTRNVMPVKQIDDVDVLSDFLKVREIQKRFKEYCQQVIS